MLEMLPEAVHLSEQHRHQCEVRHVLALRAINRQKAIDYIELVKKKRGDTGLERDASEQWALGNRGEWGRWEMKT